MHLLQMGKAALAEVLIMVLSRCMREITVVARNLSYHIPRVITALIACNDTVIYDNNGSVNAITNASNTPCKLSFITPGSTSGCTVV